MKNNFLVGLFLGANIILSIFLFMGYSRSNNLKTDNLAKSNAPDGIDEYTGEIMLFAGLFCPRNTYPCDGRLLSISQNTVLFALLGTTYGGDGVTTFALPDLRGRVPIGTGQGTGLQNYPLGQKGGSEVSQPISGGKFMVKERDASNFKINNMQPYLPIQYCICNSGIFPQRP